jgi:hypothetical protein
MIVHEVIATLLLLFMALSPAYAAHGRGDVPNAVRQARSPFSAHPSSLADADGEAICVSIMARPDSSGSVVELYLHLCRQCAIMH